MLDKSSEISIKIGKKIRLRRKTLGLSMENLADSLGVTIQTINKYEKATTRVPSPALFEIAHVLKTSLDYFFEDIQMEPANRSTKPKDTLDLKKLPLNLLVIEDNISDELLIKQAIQKNHFNVNMFVLREEDQFLKFMKEEIANVPFTTPDLVILDTRLRASSGIDLLKVIKKDPATKLIPVVIFTNSYDLTTLRVAYENGAAAFINKSFDTKETLKIIQTTLAYWSQCVILPKHTKPIPVALVE